MPDSLVQRGDKLHIVTRRLFEQDLRRHFVGEVIAVDGVACQVQGYAFVFDSNANEFRKRPELRTRILSLGDAGHIVNKLPERVDITALKYQIVNKHLSVTDGVSFSLDINEFGVLR